MSKNFKKRKVTLKSKKKCGYCYKSFNINSSEWDEQWTLHITGEKSPRLYCSDNCFCHGMDETSDCAQCGETSLTDDIYFIDGNVYCWSCAPSCMRCDLKFCNDDDNDGFLCITCLKPMLALWKSSIFTAHLCLNRSPLHRNVIPIIMSYIRNISFGEWQNEAIIRTMN